MIIVSQNEKEIPFIICQRSKLMSRFLTNNKDGTYSEEIDSLEECKWKINDMCCNDSSEYLGMDGYNDICKKCKNYEKEDGIINE